MYQLDQNAAREADSIGSYLTETGKYIGTFTRAEKLISKNKGTHGIGFTFESAGQTTRFDVWTMNAQKEHLSGYKTINAIMACMSLRGISEKPGQVERYNWDTQQKETVQAEVFPELVCKPVGLVLQKTEYEKMRSGQLTGETGWRLELVAPFRAADEFTSSEILDRKTKPVKLASIVAMLKDRPLKKRPAHVSAAAGNIPAGHPASDSGFDDFPNSDIDGEEIPF